MGLIALMVLPLSGCGSASGSGGQGHVESPYHIVAYYPSYKASQVVLPEETLRKITHVNYSFAIPSKDGSLEYGDVARSVDRTSDICRKAGVKVLVSVGGGGGTELQHAFAEAVHNKESRSVLADNLMKMTEELNLDGLDIDYEAWNLKDEAYDLELRDALEDFLKDLRVRLGDDRLLTSAVATYGKYTSAMVDCFDYVTVMAYDLTGPWGSVAGPHSPFEFFTSAIATFKEMGFPDNKIVGGVPFYGRGFPDGDPKKAYAMSYADIVDKYPGAEDKDCIDDELWYDGLSMITRKCNYVQENGLGGIMFWEITQDTMDSSKSLLDRIYSILGTEQK